MLPFNTGDCLIEVTSRTDSTLMVFLDYVIPNKGNNKITELRTTVNRNLRKYPNHMNTNQMIDTWLKRMF
jgi:hypothetical protein